jgi:regulator of protease activity HflC (stomatin/prohibitin superfamily)
MGSISLTGQDRTMNPVIASALLVAAAALVLLATSIRLVPVGTCAVVTRFGRVARVQPPGLVVVYPVLDQMVRVTLTPRRAEPVAVTAVTRDGFEVRLAASVLWQVHDPQSSIGASPDIGTATESAVERWLRHVVASQDLATLLHGRQALPRDALEELQPLTTLVGVTVLDIDLLDVELRAGPELLRLLR